MPSKVAEQTGNELLAQLRSKYPDSPFLALGQTVFWDEPVKAVLRHMLDNLGAGGEIVAGVHDTDYFAKTHLRKAGPGRFVLMAHNDGTTKDLWSAAGEISTLFGSETLPSKHELIKYGVPLDHLARSKESQQQAFVDSVTEAWGWRGLVYTGSRDLVVSRLPLKEVGAGILQMLAWAFENAVVQIGPDCCSGEAHHVANAITTWCREYCELHPELYLTDLFQHVLPRIYEMLLTQSPQKITFGGTSGLLRFCPETAGLRRFAFVDLFLDPSTREAAIDAYNSSVSGSTIYTLDKFGVGALPFDVIVPDRGRGTLRVTPRVVFVETRQPVAIGLKQPVRNIHELAEVLHRRLGDQITLVGKAVTLVSMLAQEFIFVFNEEGSNYVHRTRQMNDTLVQSGISLDMRPILRMRYETWDALAVAGATLRLPEHLAATFGQKLITAPDFANSWRGVVDEQRQLCQTSASLRRPRALLRYLEDRDPVGDWEALLDRYETCKANQKSLRAQAETIHDQIKGHYTELARIRIERAEVQQQMGSHFRATLEWTDAESEFRSAMVRKIAVLDNEAQKRRSEVRVLKASARTIETCDKAVAIRSQLREIEQLADHARLNLVRNALLTIDGLTHTNRRPTAWWFPMVDGTGKWFEKVVATTQLYTQPLLSE